MLSVLRSSSVVLDANGDVVRASPTAYSFGLVREDRLVNDALVRLTAAVRRDGEIREAELELPRGPLGRGTRSVRARVAPLGWHIVVYFEMRDLPDLESFFTSLPTVVVVDHMGVPDVARGVDDPENRRFHRLLEGHRNFWVKATCPERMTVAGPPYDDVAPFARSLVEQFPDRVIWGTDWPHPNVKWMPDDAALLELFPQMVPDAALQKRILVDNPARLYGFE